MNELFFEPQWRSLLTAVAFAPDSDDSARLGAADMLQAWGDPLRAAYIRACCVPASSGEETAGAELLPHTAHFLPLWGWVPSGPLLCFWHRGFVTRIHGPLDAVRDALPDLILREPLYQTSAGPVVTVSDRAPLHTPDGDHWTWGNETDSADLTVADGHGPMLPPPLFDLLPWPPLFDTAEAAASALSAALLSEAHELAHVA